MSEHNPKASHLTAEEMEDFQQFVSRAYGPIKTILHEKRSDALHIDLLVIPEVPQYDCQAICTMGMSGLRMDATDDFAYAEMIMFLPKSWSLEMDALADPRRWWPLEVLKIFARWPLFEPIAIFWGLSSPNGIPSEPYPGTPFHGVLVMPPSQDEERGSCQIASRTVNLHALAPLTEREMEWKMNQADRFAFQDWFESTGEPLETLLIANPERGDYAPLLPRN